MQSTEDNNVMHNNQSRKRIPATPTLPKTTNHHGGSTTTQACAACKYQRRKCATDCILAPYFPHDRQPQFLNAHRLFGVSNIIKIVRHLDAAAKDHAMRTIIYQSDARAADPVGGCYRIIRDLEQQICAAKAELEIVHHHLALCRAAAACSQEEDVALADGGEYAAEDHHDDVNSWSNCMHGNVNTHAESTSSSFPPNQNYHDHHDDIHNHHHDMKTILDQLSGEDDDDASHEEFKFDSHGNIIISSNNNSTLSEENAGIFKEEGESFLYIQDHDDLKAAATFFTITNCM